LVDALHAVAVGVWLGALLPLGLLLRQASAEAGADARPFAVIATRRFSALAFACMLVIVATGLWNAWVQVAGVPALIGTRYGWLLLGKLALLVPILVLAGMNRRRLLPALSGDGATLGRPAMARLSRLVRRECGLAVLVLGLTAALSLTAPGRHEAPWWPFAYRLSYEAMAEVPGVRTRLLLGGQLVVLGVLAGIVGALVPARRGLLVVAGAAAVAIGLGVALPPLAVDAYPTTYLRSSVPYQTASVTQGMALYAQNCATCHGPGGRGDGPGGAGLPRRPADLTAPHTAQHTAGDLFWWLTRGIPAAGMPAFADRLSGEQRWDLINFLRALSAAERARRLSPVVEPGRAWLAAPDFSFSVGPTPARTLRDLRGRWLALVVLFSLPESRPRLARLAEAYSGLQFAGAEIIAVPVDDERAIITRIGATRPPVLYPVVTEGASEIVPAYALLAQPAGRGFRAAPPPRHAEFLVDRQGYVRARWIPGSPGRGWDDLDALREQVRLLDREAPSALPPDEHVH
jgi:putative copper resistance protein D